MSQERQIQIPPLSEASPPLAHSCPSTTEHSLETPCKSTMMYREQTDEMVQELAFHLMARFLWNSPAPWLG